MYKIGDIMRRFICFSLMLLISFCVITSTLFATEGEIDPEIKAPVEVAKEYVAKKYNCDIDDLTFGDTMVGRSGAHIDIDYGYETERVMLRRKDFDSDWEVTGSEPAHQY